MCHSPWVKVWQVWDKTARLWQQVDENWIAQMNDAKASHESTIEVRRPLLSGQEVRYCMDFTASECIELSSSGERISEAREIRQVEICVFHIGSRLWWQAMVEGFGGSLLWQSSSARGFKNLKGEANKMLMQLLQCGEARREAETHCGDAIKRFEFRLDNMTMTEKTTNDVIIRRTLRLVAWREVH